MEGFESHACAVCGLEGPRCGHWFLLIENRWEDKLKILEWNDHLAGQEGVYCVCSPAHAQELVVHWMTTGRLDYPFARTAPRGKSRAFWWRGSDPGTRLKNRVRPLGELAVHRESLQRVLHESPEQLRTILDALLGALQREAHDPRSHLGAEASPEVSASSLRQV